ncbi:MAG: NAD-binding protein [Cyanobacteria bacterium P01_D01_bin.44]
MVGDVRHEETLIVEGIRDAQTLLLAGTDDVLNLAVMTRARLLNPQIWVVNRLFNTRLGDRLDHTLSDHISMSVSALVAPLFAFAVLGNRAIGQLHSDGT